MTFILVNRHQADPAIAAAASLAMIGLVWIMVKHQFLFRIIPR